MDMTTFAAKALWKRDTPRPRDPRAEDAYYAAYRNDWVDALLHAFTHAEVIPSRPAAHVTTTPSRATVR